MFGWTFEPWGPPDFWRVHTSPGGIHGALQKRRAPVTGTGVTAFECTIAVEDVAATAAAIETHGGQLTMQPFEMEHVGTPALLATRPPSTGGWRTHGLPPQLVNRGRRHAAHRGGFRRPSHVRATASTGTCSSASS